jgi:Amt family ammonium transporter
MRSIGGMVNHRNVISTMYQSFIAMGIITVLWVFIGYSLAFGDDANGSGILGNPKSYFFYKDVGALPHPLLGPTVPNSVFSMFQLMFAMITPILISGALAERINFNAWMIFISIWHLVVYCPLAHMVFHPSGILFKWGVLDFAGGIVVEMSSGFASLAGALFLGPRTNRAEAPANVPFVLLGTGLLWFGWLGFNAGSALSAGSLACQAFVTTTIAGASGMMTWILIDIFMGRPSSAVGACNGIVVGLVAITPSCGFVTAGGAMCIGFLACSISYMLGTFMKELKSIDDSLDVVTIHGVGGLIGFLSNGIFASLRVNPAGNDGLVYGQGITLAKHIAVVLVLVPCIIISSYCCFYITNLLIPLRVTAEDEEAGLDVSMHNESYGGEHKFRHDEVSKKDATIFSSVSSPV